MTYRFTFTKRFRKHFKDLTAQEKKQLQNKLQFLAENPMHPSLRTKRAHVLTGESPESARYRDSAERTEYGLFQYDMQ